MTRGLKPPRYVLIHYRHGDKLPVPTDVAVDVGGVTLVIDVEDPTVLGVDSVEDDGVLLVVDTPPLSDEPIVVPSELEGFDDVPMVDRPDVPTDDGLVGLLPSVRVPIEDEPTLVDESELLVVEDPIDDVIVEDELPTLPNVEPDEVLEPGGQGRVSDGPLVGVV